jgi:hypothetical protein
MSASKMGFDERKHGEKAENNCLWVRYLKQNSQFCFILAAQRITPIQI